MAQTKFDICSRALVRVGANPITSFDDGTAESTAAGAEYEPKVAAILSGYPWRFATELKAINKLVDTPADKWSYAYQLPADLLTLHGITRAGVDILYDRFGDKIFTDEDDDLVAEYTFRQTETRWPPYFVEAVVIELASIFAIAVARDNDLADRLAKDAEKRAWPAARLSDSKQQSTRRIAASRLVSIRR